MEPNAAEPVFEPAPEPRLALLPTPEEAVEEPGEAAPEATQDPLKLYVRAIGDGRLLRPLRSASSRGARTRATRQPKTS